MELKKDQVFLLEVGKGFLLTGEAVKAETPLGHYVLSPKPSWLPADYKPYVFLSTDPNPLDPFHTTIDWALAQKQNNQIDLIARPNNFDYQIFLSGNSVTEIELPTQMLDASKSKVDVNFIDRFYASEIFNGSDDANFERQMLFKPTGVAIQVKEQDFLFAELLNRRSITVQANNQIVDNEQLFVFIVGSGNEKDEFIDMSNLETSIPADNFINKTFVNEGTFSVFELEKDGRLIYGNDFSFNSAKNVYVGALDENEKCCVGGLITNEQRLDMEVPVKAGSSRLSLATPTPTPSVTATNSSTPPVTPTTSVTITPTPSISTSVSKSATPSTSIGSSPTPTPTSSITPSVTATPSETPTPTPTISLSVGMERPLPSSISVLQNPIPSAPIDLIGNYILNEDGISYVNPEATYAIRWFDERQVWVFRDIRAKKNIGSTSTGDRYTSLINNVIKIITEDSKRFLYSVIVSEDNNPLPNKSLAFNIGGPLSQGRDEKIKITSLGRRNIQIYMWRDQGAGSNLNSFNFRFPSTRSDFGIFNLPSNASLYDPRYARNSRIRNNTSKAIYLPTYPTERYINDGIGGNRYLSIDRYIPKPAGSFSIHQWETSSIDPIFPYEGTRGAQPTNKTISLEPNDTLYIENNSSQTFQIRKQDFKTIVLSVAPGETKSLQISNTQNFKAGDFTVRDNFDKFNNKFGQINIGWKEPQYRGQNGIYENGIIVYERKSSSNYMGYSPPMYGGWERSIYGTYSYAQQIAVFRSGGIEDGVSYDYLEFLIGGSSFTPVKVKDLVNFINTDQRLTDLISAEYFGDGMTPLSFRPDEIVAGRSSEPSIVPFDHFTEKSYFELQNAANIDLSLIYDEEPQDFGEVEVIYEDIIIPANNDEIKFFNLNQINVILENNKVALDIRYELANAPSFGMALKFSILIEGVGKILATEEKIELDSFSPKKGSHEKILNNLFDKLPVRDSQLYKTRKSNKLFLAAELTKVTSSGAISTVQVIKSDIITSQLVDRIEKKENYYKSEKFSTVNAPFDILPEEENSFSYEIQSLKDYTNQNVDIEYSRLKILIPKAWRLIKDATLRIRVLPSVETKQGNASDLSFIDGVIFNKSELGQNDIPVDGQGSNPDSYFWANSSHGYAGVRERLPDLYASPSDEASEYSEATYFSNNLDTVFFNHNDIIKEPASFSDLGEQALFLQKENVLEIVMPISSDSGSNFYLDENGDPYIHTPFLNNEKAGNVYFTVSLLCGKNYEETEFFEGDLSGPWKESMEIVNQDLINAYKKYILRANASKDLADLSTYAQFFDIDRNNTQYQTFAWSDGYWARQNIIIYEGEDTEDGPIQSYGTAEFEANPRYALYSLDDLPEEAKNFEGNPNVLGSILGKYYKYTGNPEKRGRVFYVTDGISDPKILKHLKDSRVAEHVYNAYYNQKVLLTDLKSTFNSLWNETHPIYQTYAKSEVMGIEGIEGWSARPDNGLSFNSLGEKNYPYASPGENEDTGYNYPAAVVRRMLMYLCTTYYNELNYNTYLDPRKADAMEYQLAGFTLARTRDEEWAKMMGVDMSEQSTRGGYGNMRNKDAMVNPFAELQEDPQIFIGENGCIIYREPVYVSMPFITLFTNVLSHHLNAYRGGEVLGIPQQFPLDATKSFMDGSENGIIFGAVHQRLKDFFNFYSVANEGQSSATYYNDQFDGNSMLGEYTYDQLQGLYMEGDPYIGGLLNFYDSYMPSDVINSYGNSYDNYYDNSYESNSYPNPGNPSQTRENINVLQRISNELKLNVNVLFGMRWVMAYPSKDQGDLILCQDHNVKLREGYSNDIRPSAIYDTKSTLEYKFRNDILFGSSLGFNINDPEYDVAQGNEFVKVYGSLLDSSSFAIEPEQYKKIFWSQSEWATKLRNDNNSTSNPNYGRAQQYIDLVNYFQGKIKYSMNNFPFKDFGMEPF